jgi:hypothetical protein
MKIDYNSPVVSMSGIFIGTIPRHRADKATAEAAARSAFVLARNCHRFPESTRTPEMIPPYCIVCSARNLLLILRCTLFQAHVHRGQIRRPNSRGRSLVGLRYSATAWPGLMRRYWGSCCNGGTSYSA